MATQLSRKRAYSPPPIPDRLYFKIGDVARLCGVESYVLRFWESQFPQLKPNKSGTGQRLYRRRDVELAMEIKRLVHAEGYTLSGARAVLEPSSAAPLNAPAALIPRPSCRRLPVRTSRSMRRPQSSATPALSCAKSPACWPLRRRSRHAAATASPPLRPQPDRCFRRRSNGSSDPDEAGA